jgi:anti-sigma factor RsiW
LREALRFEADEPIPAQLRLANLLSGRSPRRGRPMALAASLVVAIGLGAVGGWFGRDLAGPGEAPTRAQLAVGAHRVFAADLRRPVEIRAEAQDQLVQWLSNRLERPIAIPDLGAAGLRFMGGRLIATPDGPAAQLMYDDDAGTRLTLFLEAEPRAASEDVRYARVGGFGALSWADRRFAYTVSAASSQDRLALVGDLVRRQLPAAERRS